MDVVQGKGLIKLNRPKALNALNMNMVQQIYPVLQGWNETETAKVDFVIIEGEGSKAFCAGGDIRAITSAPAEQE